jgi:hypothetical protein
VQRHKKTQNYMDAVAGIASVMILLVAQDIFANAPMGTRVIHTSSMDVQVK